ncbi:peroxiredoxin [Hygrophoropsis aurantiaca]|uniref:Peroxiredoxin n=1 Tax=Hygrophoropsis aurantiaca TaxID=72124 RepID=A0ACB8AD37_9AGAM|nr:peroxiredoxin [Hygrophoropsis aurantiaca]
MSTPNDWNALPSDLPVPEDDGSADHLTSYKLPEWITLPATTGAERVNLFSVSLERPVLVFAYPRTGQPGIANPEGWDEIPGARGCTPELCAVRDSITTLYSLAPNLAIFALSSQDTAYQKEVAERLHLPYPILSDQDLALTKALKLPTFDVSGEILIKRITLLLNAGEVVGFNYPVFPSDEAAKKAELLLSGAFGARLDS